MITNKELYGDIHKPLNKIRMRRLHVAAHCCRRKEEPLPRFILWTSAHGKKTSRKQGKHASHQFTKTVADLSSLANNQLLRNGLAILRPPLTNDDDDDDETMMTMGNTTYLVNVVAGHGVHFSDVVDTNYAVRVDVEHAE